MKRIFVAAALAALITSGVQAADWPMWGGTPSRNMVNPVEKNMPTEWDVKTGKNILWSVKLGSQSYGNPAVSNGRIFLGTNNQAPRDPAITGDKGNLYCIQASDGTFLWQIVHDKLTAGRVNDWPLQGICSSPAVGGNRVYYFNNRCEVVAADTAGLDEGPNDGLTTETYKGKGHGDIIWSHDLMEELGVFPHNIATSSPLLLGDKVYVVSGNGVDEGHLHLPSELAPSFAAFNTATGELAWEFFELDKILHGQWSSPAAGKVNGKWQVYFPGGDGWLYALDAETGKEIWKFNCNPADSVWELGGLGTRNNLIATPVFHDNHVYIGVGQDPEHGYGIGHFYAIDATGTGDVTASHQSWHRGNTDFGRTMSTAAVADGLIYICDLEGNFSCLDVKTGEPYWQHELKSAVWGSPMVVDGKVYIGDEDGDVTIFEHAKELKIINEINMGHTVYSTAVAANGVLYLMTTKDLYAISAK